MSTVFNSADDVAEAVIAALSLISIANGFRTDIGLQIYEGKTNLEAKQVPEGGAMVMIEGIDSINDQPGRLPSALIEQRYSLIGFHQCDPDNPNVTARAVIADIKKAIFAKDVTMGGRAKKVRYISRDIGTRADGTNIVLGLVEIGIQYVEPLVIEA